MSFYDEGPATENPDGLCLCCEQPVGKGALGMDRLFCSRGCEEWCMATARARGFPFLSRLRTIAIEVSP